VQRLRGLYVQEKAAWLLESASHVAFSHHHDSILSCLFGSVTTARARSATAHQPPS
jgi:hypothetical protein